MTDSFVHHHSAHCESGVTAGLLTHYGLPMSEAMAFGIGSGLFFAYFPFIRVNGLPMSTFRCAPGGIFRLVAKRLKIGVERRTFGDSQRGMAALDGLLDRGIVVGAQTGVFWLPYFPPALRFHFNAHNIVIFGREAGGYRISDPIIGEPVVCPAADLERARFARGVFAPRGRLYWLTDVPRAIDLTPAILESIRDVSRVMTRTPVPLIGVAGMRYLASSIERWPARLGARRAALYLGQLIRMQEEIGTGGGGFRFIYAAFLQEAAGVLGDARYLDLSARMTAIGDRWRDVAVAGVRHCKGEMRGDVSYADVAALVRECAGLESALFRDLDATARSPR